eukprot:2237526-Lingulodinium_polyedra.AAC.1
MGVLLRHPEDRVEQAGPSGAGHGGVLLHGCEGVPSQVRNGNLGVAIPGRRAVQARAHGAHPHPRHSRCGGGEAAGPGPQLLAREAVGVLLPSGGRGRRLLEAR